MTFWKNHLRNLDLSTESRERPCRVKAAAHVMSLERSGFSETVSEPVQPALPVATPLHCSGLSLLTQPPGAFKHNTFIAGVQSGFKSGIKRKDSRLHQFSSVADFRRYRASHCL